MALESSTSKTSTFCLRRPVTRLWAHRRPCGGLLPGAILLAIICAVVAGRPAQAAIVVEPLESAAPELYRAPTGQEPPAEIEELKQALASFEKQQYDRCWDQLTEARKKHAALPPVRLMLARFFLTYDLLPPGRVALEQAAAETPEYPGVYLTFGQLALRENRVTDAMLHFKNALPLVESGKWLKNQRLGFTVEAHAGLAAVAERRRDWSSARDHLNRWLELHPGNGQARYRLAHAIFLLGEEQKAYDELHQAAKDDPSLDLPAIAMGWFHTRNGSPEKAGKWMEVALKAAPDDPQAHAAVAAWLLGQRRPAEAKQRAETALKLDPESKRARFLCGLVARHLNDHAEAERYFEAVQRLDPTDLAVANQLALVLIEQPDEAKRRRALELAEKNAQSFPNSTEALSTLGWAYYRANRLEDAERTLRSASSKGALHSDTLYFFAQVLADRGRVDEARETLKQALQPRGDFFFRTQAEQLLGRLENPSE